jgi:hypothetical protein
MSSKQEKPKRKPKVVKLKKRKIRIKSVKSCETLQTEYNEGKISKNIGNADYQALLKCVSDKDREELSKNEGEFEYLYPNMDDPLFNVKIAKKKEFFDTRYEPRGEEEYKNIEAYTQKLCDNTEFELDPHQMFVRNFLSFQTPYNGLLLYHGLGVGKTCSAISICEEMRTYLQQMGITKRLIIVASPAVQENFKLQLFDERKLRKVNGLWNIKACTGNKFIKEINPMNMRGLSRKKIIRQIKRLIRQSYMFKGYGEFANYIEKIMNKNIPRGSSTEVANRIKKKNLRKEFSNRMLVIDEVHNIRLSKEGKVKASSDNLGKLVEATSNLKLLLLSATPMFDSYSEIIWILNLLLLNDKRYPVSEREIFTMKGEFQTRKGEQVGKNLLMRKATGYISYVRGENPFTFPYRIWPQMALNPQSLFTLKQDGIWNYPEYQINGADIIQPIELIDLVINQIGDYQDMGYKKLVDHLKRTNPKLTRGSGSISFTVLEAPLQALNMIYPHEGLAEDDVDSDVFPVTYGSKGLARVMKFDPRTKRNFSYKDKTKKQFGEIFSPSEIGKYSGKISYICDKIRESKGIVFVYSQYIDGGAVPIALALESMGITRYGRTPSLFKTAPAPPLNVLTMRPKEEGKPFKPAKYMMITGQKSLSSEKDRELSLLAATDDDNINGEKIKVIIVSRAGSEGLDFKNIRQMHILDPWYNLNRAEQVIGRAVRNKSHCMLPYNNRNVEIYLYGTELKDSDEEAIDLYIYRVAERKGLLIANVSRVLKETAIDCLLNRKGLDFSETAIARIAPNHNVVKQTLSTGNTIDYTLGDKDGTLICDFRNCEYKCLPPMKEGDDIDRNTYNETFIIMNLDKILQRIRNLFKEKYIYRKTELLQEVTAIKNYPLDQIYTALSYLINDDNEFIMDPLNRMGRLVNVGEYYMFQPIELTNKHISRYERVTPIPYKRKELTFILPELKVKSLGDITDINEKLIESHKMLLVPRDITSSNRSNWVMSCAWVINNLVKYNSERFNHTKSSFFTILQNLAMHHIIDILTYEEKVLLLRNMQNIDDSIVQFVQSYFDKFRVDTSKYQGMVITDFNKKSKYAILTLKDDEWVIDSAAISGGLGKATLDKFTVSVDDMYDKIGFMAQVKKFDLIFKVKSIYLSSSGRPTKGSSCERGADKKVLIQNINTMLNLIDDDIKYVMGAKTGKGARTITQIYDKEGVQIKQHPYAVDEDGNFIKTKRGFKYDKNRVVRINAFQLCIEQELLFRYFDSIALEDKKWFFSSLEAIINNVETIGKKKNK